MSLRTIWDYAGSFVSITPDTTKSSSAVIEDGDRKIKASHARTGSEVSIASSTSSTTDGVMVPRPPLQATTRMESLSPTGNTPPSGPTTPPISPPGSTWPSPQKPPTDLSNIYVTEASPPTNRSMFSDRTLYIYRSGKNCSIDWKENVQPIPFNYSGFSILKLGHNGTACSEEKNRDLYEALFTQCNNFIARKKEESTNTPKQEESPTSLLTKEEENRITGFYNAGFLHALQMLAKVVAWYSPARQEYENLIGLLKQTPREPMDPIKAKDDLVPQAIANAALLLYNKVKYIKNALIFAEIVVNASSTAAGIYAGAKCGAMVGATLGGGVGSVPAAFVGAAVGGAVGGILCQIGMWGTSNLGIKTSRKKIQTMESAPREAITPKIGKM